MDNPSCIFGQNDINSLLSQFPHIEEQHYNLWISSINVIKHILHRAEKLKSSYIIKDALEKSSLYVHTENHMSAEEKLENLHTIIITGDPGIGKTTLAKHISLEYFQRGFEFIAIEKSIDEAYALLEEREKQIFYFDDFLGSNYLTALEKNEDSRIMSFINIARRSVNTRFILTSRTNILNQGKILGQKFTNDNIERNEYVLDTNSIKNIEKAKILYNRIWHSDLPEIYIDEIYQDKRYHRIISHPNYNPRIIEYFTDAYKVLGIPADQYWNHIESSLSNPKDVWEHPFTAQLSDAERAIVLLATVNNERIEEKYLSKSFSNYKTLVGIQSASTLEGSFANSSRVVTKSLLSRIIDGRKVYYSLQNPSIADYLFSHYIDDAKLQNSLISLQTKHSLNHTFSLNFEDGQRETFANKLLKQIFSAEIPIILPFEICVISHCIKSNADFSDVEKTIVSKFEKYNHFRELLRYEYLNILFFFSHIKKISDAEISKIITSFKKDYGSKEELSLLVQIANTQTKNKLPSTLSEIQSIVFEYLYDNVYEISDIGSIIGEMEITTTGYGDGDYGIEIDADYAAERVEDSLRDELQEIGIDLDNEAIYEISGQIDYDDLANQEMVARSRSYDYSETPSKNSSSLSTIDDLFDRG